MDYLDFELCVGKGEGRTYPLSVVRSPAGEQKATMEFPLDDVELRDRLQTLQIALLKSGSTRRDLAMPREYASVEEFGRALFGALLPAEIRSGYRLSRERAKQEGKGLRLRLRIEAPDLAALPWEFLYDDSEGDFVCLSTDTPVVRYLELDRSPEVVTVAPPLRILGMIASPGDRAALDVEHERERMTEVLADLEADGRVTLSWLEGPTWRDLQRAMRGGPWHVFHFVGHGGFDAAAGEGVLLLADEAGGAYPLPATQLGRLLADHDPLRLAVLNACEGAQASDVDLFSSTASVLIRRGLPAVVAMQYEITDRAAIEFSHEFYQSIADGLPVDAAVAEARKAVSLAVAHTVEWGTPVLHMRAPDGRLFDLDAPPPAASAPAASAPAAPAPAASGASPAGAAALPPAVGPAGAAAPAAAGAAPAPPRGGVPWPTVLAAVAGLAALVAVVLAVWQPVRSDGAAPPAPGADGPGLVAPSGPEADGGEVVPLADSTADERPAWVSELRDAMRRERDARQAALSAGDDRRNAIAGLLRGRDDADAFRRRLAGADGLLLAGDRTMGALPVSPGPEADLQGVRDAWEAELRALEQMRLRADRWRRALGRIEDDLRRPPAVPDPPAAPAVSDCHVVDAAAMDGGPSVVYLGEPVRIAAAVRGAEAVVVDFDLGDGLPSASGLNAVHRYTEAGLYRAAVRASNASATATCELEVRVLSTRAREMAEPVDPDAFCDLVELNPVYFSYGSDGLAPRGHRLLDENVELLVEQTACAAFVDGYTDGTEADAFGTALAGRRARAVVAYYLRHGVDASRLQIRDRGVAFPDCDKEDPGEGCQRNRRAESLPLDVRRFLKVLRGP